MAETKVVVTLKWENGNYFTLTSKEGDGEVITILRMEENACISKLWDNAQGVCINFASHLLSRIGNEMKAD